MPAMGVAPVMAQTARMADELRTMDGRHQAATRPHNSRGIIGIGIVIAIRIVVVINAVDEPAAEMMPMATSAARETAARDG